MAKSNTITAKITIDKALKDFLLKRNFHNFKTLTEDSYDKIEKEEERLNRFLGIYKEKNTEAYLFHLMENLKCTNDLTDEERIYLIIKAIDPDCLTYKYYINFNIPDVREYERAYNLATDSFFKQQARLYYEEKVKERNKVIGDLRTKLIDKIGVFVPSLIKYEKVLLLMQRKKDLITSVEKNSLKGLVIFLQNEESILPLSNEDIDRINIEIEKYILKFPIPDINLLSFHVLNQSNILGLNNIGEQVYFLINTINRYYPEDQNLNHIVDYNGTWDNMNDELKQKYGIKSEPLLRLQNCYNKIYNIKGDF